MPKEKNKQEIKRDITFLNMSNKVDNLQEENKDLKNSFEIVQNNLFKSTKENKALQAENKKLKEKIKDNMVLSEESRHRAWAEGYNKGLKDANKKVNELIKD